VPEVREAEPAAGQGLPELRDVDGRRRAVIDHAPPTRPRPVVLVTRLRRLPEHVRDKVLRPGTRAWLLRRLAYLLGAAVAMLATSLWAVAIVADTAGTVRDRTTEAVLETAAARLALSAADEAAITSLASGHAVLSGPGQDYTNRLAAAQQSLAKVAEANQVGTGGGTLQVVAGLVAAYTSAIAQADANLRDPASAGLGTADLWYASRLLHAPDSGVLAQLEQLQREQRAALAEQLDEGTARPRLLGFLPAVLVVPTALLLLLVLTQRRFAQRFRRRLNPWLSAATLGTAVVLAALVLTIFQQGRLNEVDDRVDTVLAVREEAIDHHHAVGQNELNDLLRARCAEACGATVDRFRQEELPPVGNDDRDFDTDAKQVSAQTGVAVDSAGREWAVPLLGLGVVVLILVGLLDRLREYRYRA
jgi:hypothetical protein